MTNNMIFTISLIIFIILFAVVFTLQALAVSKLNKANPDLPERVKFGGKEVFKFILYNNYDNGVKSITPCLRIILRLAYLIYLVSFIFVIVEIIFM